MTPNSRAARVAVVAGAGGFLGEAIVRAFVESGWTVRGLVRDRSRLPRVERAGGQGIVADVLDAGSVRRATEGSSVIVHVAAAGATRPDDPDYARRVRVEGCRNLLAAARHQPGSRLIVGSGYWVYADNPGTITEKSPLDPKGESRINFATEQVATDGVARGDTPVVIVRPGMVYGPGSWCAGVVEQIRAGTYAYVGEGQNAWSFVSRADAGKGFVRVAEHGADGEVYNLVDGHPAPWKEFGDLVAARLGSPAPSHLSWNEAVEAHGPDVAYHLSARRACSSAKIESLGWRPEIRDFHLGLSEFLSPVPDGTAPP